MEGLFYCWGPKTFIVTGHGAKLRKGEDSNPPVAFWHQGVSMITLKQLLSSYSWNTPLDSSIIFPSCCFLENKMGIFQVIISTTLFNRSFMRFTFTFSCSCLSFLLAMTLIWLTGGKFKRAFESSPFLSPWPISGAQLLKRPSKKVWKYIYIYIYIAKVLFSLEYFLNIIF